MRENCPNEMGFWSQSVSSCERNILILIREQLFNTHVSVTKNIYFHIVCNDVFCVGVYKLNHTALKGL